MGLGKANQMCNLFFAFVIWSDAERFCEHEHFCNIYFGIHPANRH